MYKKKVFNKITCILLGVLYFTLSPSMLFARTVYVSDLSVNIRSGAGLENNVIAVGKKDDSLKVLDENSSWYNVELASGKIGWISKKMIKHDKPYSAVIGALKERLNKYRTGTETLKDEVELLTEKMQDQVLKIEELKIRNDNLSMENSELKDSKEQVWILAALLSSTLIWLMGFLAGHYRLRKEDKRLADMADAALIIPHIPVSRDRGKSDRVSVNGKYNNVGCR